MLIWGRYSVSLRIQSECGKMRTRITSNTDTFYAVTHFMFSFLAGWKWEFFCIYLTRVIFHKKAIFEKTSTTCFHVSLLEGASGACIYRKFSNVHRLLRWSWRATAVFHGFCEVFLESDIVLGSLRQFLELSNSSWKSQTVLGIFKQFSKVSNRFWDFQTVLGSLKQFLEFLNSWRKSQTVLRIFKQFSEVSNSSLTSEVLNSSRNSLTVRGLRKLLGFLKSSQCYQRAFAELPRGVLEK